MIVNHLGCLKLDAGDGAPQRDARIAEWRKGMSALAAAGPHVSVKISMLAYTDPDWDNASGSGTTVVPGLVKEVIAMFGAKRCMFASNFPVEKADGFDAERLFRGFRALAAHLSPADQHALFAGTAQSVYRLAP